MTIPLFGKLVSATGQPYADADAVEVDTTNFNKNLSASDDEIQKALETIDELDIGGEVFNPADHSVTEFNDITDAGSGEIITAAERQQQENNTSEITAIRAILAQEEVVYRYIGSIAPTIPSSYRGEYYVEIVNPIEDITTTLPNFAHNENATKYGVVNKSDTYNVIINSPSGYSIDGGSNYIIRPDSFAYFVKKDDTRWVVGLSGTNTDEAGIELDDGVNDVGGIKKLVVNGMKVEAINTTDANLKSYTELMTLDGDGNPTQYTGQGHVIELNPPLRAYPHPSAQDTLIMDIQQGYYEKVHVPGFLGYLGDTESILPRFEDENKYFKGALFFENVVKDRGAFIEIDRTNKAYGIQEFDGLDPNVSGGNDYLIVFRAALIGTAPRDGNVRLELVKKDADPSDPDLGYITDKNGKPIVVERAFKSGQRLGIMEAAGIVNVTGLQEFKCIVTDTFQQGEVILGDRANGGTGLLIQCLTSEYKTGDALQQFELDTAQNLEYSSYYLGADIIDFKADFTYPVAETLLTAGNILFKTHNAHLLAGTNLLHGQGNNHLNIKDDGAVTMFSLDEVIDNEKSHTLKGKPMRFSVTMTNDNSDFDAYVCKYTGDSTNTRTSIVSGFNGDGSPIFRSGWSVADQFLIPQTSLGTDVTTNHDLVLPTDASINNFGFLIKPTTATFPFECEIGNLNAECTDPFTGYYLKLPSTVEEAHLEFDKEYKGFSLNSEGNQTLRFTINNLPITGTPMPTGNPGKGLAPIESNSSVDDIPPQDSTYGRAGIKVKKSGRVDVKTGLRLYSEKSTDTSVTFWWEIYNAGADNFKIDASETTFDIKANSSNIAYSMNEWGWDATTDMVFLLKAQASETDGSFLESYLGGPDMVDIDIDFKSLSTGESADEPADAIFVGDELDQVWEIKSGTDGRLETLQDGELPENTNYHVIGTDFDTNDFVVDQFGGITLVDKPIATDYTEISADTDLDGPRNYIVDTLTPATTVTINIPFEETSSFTVRDEKKEFDAYNCIVTIRDASDSIVHTATLNNRDKGWIFYNSDGTENGWNYGEIGKGGTTAIASDHVASVDFPATELSIEIYDPNTIADDVFDMDNMAESVTSKVMTADERTKLGNMSSNGTGDHWVSGLMIAEDDPKSQSLQYNNGTYMINGFIKTVATGGDYDLTSHYTGLTSYQHAFVTIYVDGDEVIKSTRGPAADKYELPDTAAHIDDSVTLAFIEIKVDNGGLPKDIGNKEIQDARCYNNPNSDEFVKVSADDTTTGHLIDKLSNNGNISFTIENVGSNETIKADYSGSSNPPRLNAHLSTNLSLSLEIETIIEFNTVENALDISLSSGEITFTHGGKYCGHLILSIDEDRDPEVYVWVEKKPISTGVWELANNMSVLKVKEDGTYFLPGDVEVDSGDIIRFKIYYTKSDATADLISISKTFSLGTLVQESASVSLIKVGEVTP